MRIIWTLVTQDILGDKLPQIVQTSVNTFCHFWIREVATVQEAVDARSLELVEECLTEVFLMCGRRETSEPDAYARPWFTLKYGSQKQTMGLRTRQKNAEAAGLIMKSWFTFKSGSQKRKRNLHLLYKTGSQNWTRKCLSGQINTTLHSASVIVRSRGFSSRAGSQDAIFTFFFFLNGFLTYSQI